MSTLVALGESELAANTFGTENGTKKSRTSFPPFEGNPSLQEGRTFVSVLHNNMRSLVTERELRN